MASDSVLSSKPNTNSCVDYHSKVNQPVDQKVLDDYYAFFSGQDIDMLSYVYAEPSDSYSDLVQKCTDYYVFNDEVATIRENKSKLSNYLENVINIIEVGPGFDYVIERKTLPIFSCAKKLKRYYAIDHSANYLDNACDFIKSRTTGIEIHTLEADLMNGAINLPPHSGKNCIISLGITLGNFTNIQQCRIVKQFASIIDSGDMLILTADTNKDANSVVKAYTGDSFTNFARCALWHFAKLNPAFLEHVMSFEIKCAWNEAESLLDRYFVPIKDISFSFGAFGTITIQKGQELRGIKSRKHNVDEMKSLLKDYFKILDVISYSNKMKTFICQKI